MWTNVVRFAYRKSPRRGSAPYNGVERSVRGVIGRGYRRGRDKPSSQQILVLLAALAAWCKDRRAAVGSQRKSGGDLVEVAGDRRFVDVDRVDALDQRTLSDDVGCQVLDADTVSGGPPLDMAAYSQ